MNTSTQPVAIYHIDAGGNPVYMPGVTFEFECFTNGVEVTQYGVYQNDLKIGLWASCSRTGQAELSFIPEIYKRNWFVETTACLTNPHRRTTGLLLGPAKPAPLIPESPPFKLKESRL